MERGWEEMAQVQEALGEQGLLEDGTVQLPNQMKHQKEGLGDVVKT